MYKSLVHDSFAASSAVEQKIDDRVAEAILEPQDPEIIDLRRLNEKCSQHLMNSGMSCRDT